MVGLILLAGSWSSLMAAENPIDAALASSRQAMQQLDQSAGECLASLQQSSVAESESCVLFNQRLNGELLENYINGCREARSWRDEFVSRQIDSPEPSSNSEETLQLMVEVEFLCGEEALLNRTEFVATAYQTLTINRIPSSRSQQDLSSLRQELMIDRERDRLMDSFQQLQLRQRQETQRQIDRQELELIRQQTDAINRQR